MVHAIVNKYLGRHQPRLWSEGIAELLSFDDKIPLEYYSAELLYSRVLVPLSALIDDDTFKTYRPNDTYIQSGSFVKFLIESYGRRKFSHMVKRVSKKSSTAIEIFECVYNTSLQHVEKEWRCYLAEYLKQHKKEIEDIQPFMSALRHSYYKNYPAALSDIALSLRINDKNPYVYYIAGRCHFFMGDHESATNNFLKAITLPQINKMSAFAYVRSYLYLGKICDLMGNRKKAIEYYNRVLEYTKFCSACCEAREFLDTAYKRV